MLILNPSIAILLLLNLMGSERVIKKILCSMIVVLLVSTQSFAQNNNQSTSKIGPKKQLTMIFLSGLGGAVLGLSTLSFHGRPQDHLGNIAIGFAVGVVFGTIYVTYNTATKPKEYLGETLDPLYFNPTNRESADFKPVPQLASYTLTF